MKLRLRGNSLRLRLTKTEISTLRDEGCWQDATSLGTPEGSRLVYRVETAELEKPAVNFTSGTETVITVAMPVAEVLTWANSSQVGISFETPWGLKVAVEKDFQCLDPLRDEDESDNFDNPNAGDNQHGVCHADD